MVDTYYADAPGVPREKLVKLTDYEALQSRLDAAYESLKRANASAEKFEREWYLRGDELEAAQSRLASCELALAAVCDTNGGELYWSRETLDGLGTMWRLELDDMGSKGFYFRLVERWLLPE